MTTLNEGIVRRESKSSVDEVLRRLLSFLQSKSIQVFAIVDHSGEAEKVGFEMHNTKLVIFGNPKAGTPIMLASPDSALDLPLKILIAELPNGRTQVSYNSPAYLAARYAIAPELMRNIAGVEQIAAAITIDAPLT